MRATTCWRRLPVADPNDPREIEAKTETLAEEIHAKSGRPAYVATTLRRGAEVWAAYTVESWREAP
ncbi:hypothetical protein [Magnetospirillum sp. UT-4]|uniref:hypothetical protein n=1 Tax=Magnetospirillum sp. UT-4 TaxID=2681467 RepID=UPI00137C70D1|nr:hypothetical protein [Magnetospirillum sp. UT-4]CAA7619267.1 hypothetical protein MTBUT4_300017 [Magnetospirillum sp. UT-4]